MHWMIVNRNITPNGLGDEFADLTFWKNESQTATDFAAWKQLKLMIGLEPMTCRLRIGCSTN